MCKVSNSFELSCVIRRSVDRANFGAETSVFLDRWRDESRAPACGVAGDVDVDDREKSVCEILIRSSLFFCGSHVKEVDEARSRIRARISIRPRETEREREREWNEVFREYAKN